MGQIGATALVAVALVVVVAHAAIGYGQKLSADPDPSFTISSTISNSPTSQNSALLYPGVVRYLWYTAHNSLLVPISVISIRITRVAAPQGCLPSNLDFSQTTFRASPDTPLVVPAGETNSVAVPISLINTDSNQDSCENKEFTFSFAGSARYTEVYGTANAVNSSANPSLPGQSVAYTATVTASAAADQDPVPSSPTGTVTFMDGPTAICSSVPMTSTGITTSTATCSPLSYSSTGTHSITAIYNDADGNFSGSTSPVLTQDVNS